MNPQNTGLGEFLYEAKIHFTEVVEYGASMEVLSSESTALPSEGARFDFAFQGSVLGPRLSGRMAGTDYLYVRADGRIQLHIHAQITTDNGVNISFLADGVSTQEEGAKASQLRAAISLFTSSPEYIWLNKLQVWALGTIDSEKGEVLVKAYVA